MSDAATIAALRDQFAVAVYPTALAGAFKGYQHMCPAVMEKAVRDAYEAADVALKYRATLKDTDHHG